MVVVIHFVKIPKYMPLDTFCLLQIDRITKPAIAYVNDNIKILNIKKQLIQYINISYELIMLLIMLRFSPEYDTVAIPFPCFRRHLRT